MKVWVEGRSRGRETSSRENSKGRFGKEMEVEGGEINEIESECLRQHLGRSVEHLLDLPRYERNGIVGCDCEGESR
jgi:hypothetical protein